MPSRYSDIEFEGRPISTLSYNELIGIVRETNRPPGGEVSISAVARRVHLRPGLRALEIGTSTGVTAIELAALTGCKVVGVDINSESLRVARSRAVERGVEKLCEFVECDATSLEFADNSFDVVFCGNTTSLIANRELALAEYSRVLRAGGFLAAIPMYYTRAPASELVKEVSALLGVEIVPLERDYWLRFFLTKPFFFWHEEQWSFDNIDPEVVRQFAQELFSQPHLRALSDTVRGLLLERYVSCLQSFRVNLAHMGYSILITRKEEAGRDRMLFTATRR